MCDRLVILADSLVSAEAPPFLCRRWQIREEHHDLLRLYGYHKKRGIKTWSGISRGYRQRKREGLVVYVDCGEFSRVLVYFFLLTPGHPWRERCIPCIPIDQICDSSVRLGELHVPCVHVINSPTLLSPTPSSNNSAINCYFRSSDYFLQLQLFLSSVPSFSASHRLS